jgi:lysozyme
VGRTAARKLLGAGLGLVLTACSATHDDSAPDPNKITAGIFLDEARGALPEGFKLRAASDPGIALTKESEGFVGHLYNDAAGYCSVAYGHLVHKTRCDGTEPAALRPAVSQPRGAALLISDMAMAEYAVMTSVRIDLTDPQYAALVDFTYNVGAGKLEKSTLLVLINARKFGDVPAEWNKWVLADGKPFPGLVRRRQREIDLFYGGQVPQSRAALPEGAKIQLIDIRVGG